jgi:hypothetical protein
MRPLSTDEDTRLFGVDGPMGTFSNRIAVAYAFGVIDADDRKKFDFIREMRNACAHSRMPLSFETRELAGVMSLLLGDSGIVPQSPAQARAIFLGLCALLFAVLVNGKSESAKAHINAIVERVYEKRPATSQ